MEVVLEVVLEVVFEAVLAALLVFSSFTVLSVKVSLVNSCVEFVLIFIFDISSLVFPSSDAVLFVQAHKVPDNIAMTRNSIQSFLMEIPLSYLIYTFFQIVCHIGITCFHYINSYFIYFDNIIPFCLIATYYYHLRAFS